MLKGQVFAEQVFENQIFAYFIDTFLGGKCGIGKYGNNMQLSYSGSNITIQNGVCCIRGRFLNEDSNTTINAGTNDMFCKLVIEIDLDKENTEESFLQGSYKVITDFNGYPSITQTDIVKNNSGIYQYELARFRTNQNGIVDFQDKRTFLDFESIYEEIREHIDAIDDGSIFELKGNYIVVSGTTDSYWGEANVNYPTGFNKDNCFVEGVKYKGVSSPTSAYHTSQKYCQVYLYQDQIKFQIDSEYAYKDVNFKILLRKV